VTRHDALTRENLKTPRSAAIAGMLFSILLITAFVLFRVSAPTIQEEPGAWLSTSSNTVALALNLVPFAGIAFLWFIGVIRDRLSDLEDQFFATVFLGSGILFLGMLFSWAAVTGAMLMTFGGDGAAQPGSSAAFAFARADAYSIVNVYMIKMAGVFMISTSTVAVYTRFTPRWLAIAGYVLSLVLLLGSYYLSWCFVVFPIWVFLISLFILKENMSRPSAAAISRE
jgi:hypothetical protein